MPFFAKVVLAIVVAGLLVLFTAQFRGWQTSAKRNKLSEESSS